MLSVALVALVLSSPPELHARGLVDDAQLLRRALQELHPGNHRYRSPQAEGRAFDKLVRDLQTKPQLTHAYAAFSEYLAGIRCGHTFLNPYNQPDSVRQVTFDQEDKLPFLASWFGESLVVTQVPGSSPLKVGDSILTINGMPIRTVYRRLLARTRADGGRDNARRYRMGWNGAEYEESDAILPAILPRSGAEWKLTVERNSETRTVQLRPVSRQDRSKALGKPVQTYDNWSFEMLPSGLGVLRLPHFVTWRMKSDWRRFLKDSVAKLRATPDSALLIDLRGCEGGSNDPLLALAAQLLTSRTPLRQFETRTAFAKVPDDLRPLLNTWDDSAFDLSAQVRPRSGGGFARPTPPTFSVGPYSEAFPGPVYVAINAANTSGGFLAAWLLQESGRVTLVGEETGGSRRGLNAGQMFFLGLPHSEIKVDIPIYATFPLDAQPERGIVPDIRVRPTRQDLLSGRDPVLDAVQKRLRETRVGKR